KMFNKEDEVSIEEYCIDTKRINKAAAAEGKVRVLSISEELLTSRNASMAAAAAAASQCIFCQIASKSTSTTLLHTDDKVVAFQDIRPAAVRHYLVIPVDHIPTVKDLQRKPEDYSLVNHMLEVGKMLIQRDAPQCHQYRLSSRSLFLL
ncbi:histidine triad nucleotide-binding 4, partial [Prunus dulcis]